MSKKSNDFIDFRRQLRLISEDRRNFRGNQAILDMRANSVDSSEEEDGPDISYYERFSFLVNGDVNQVPYFTNFLFAQSEQQIIEAFKSLPNLILFLKNCFLAGSENDTLLFHSMMLILIIQSLDVDLSPFCDPAVFALIFRNLQYYNVMIRIYSLTMITNLIIDYPQIYESLSEAHFLDILMNLLVFEDRDGKSEKSELPYRAKESLFFELANAIATIAKLKIFKPEDCPKLWDISVMFINDGDFSDSIEKSIGVLGILASAGFVQQFPQNIMEYFASCVLDGISILKSFIFFLKNMGIEFFKELLQYDLLENIILVISNDVKENGQVIYQFLGEIQFHTYDENFIFSTLDLLDKGRFQTRVNIIYYLSRILTSTSTKLIQNLIEYDILFCIEELLSVDDSEVSVVCLTFLEIFFNTFKSASSQKITEIPNADVILSQITDIISTISDEVDEQINRILALAA
ncbi:hypothetical protein TRFO_27510 [Tritrichomonas foetus]|uniref:SPIN90/Ldb17 leucine-rich domain-containing protein n=1 Tax=Tritrichomonas foetus TaxID=1144522 RepID=A0A1J4K0F4_9EUKA|nr:hypothetical protein TRFO_27510 [Tritrichomonas foetus]|eukprot:OHT04897.1 hypothetical protein TRFO_27510 [Tritrichomonas foetus]